MKHRKAGIYKGVSEAVYPADILSERDISNAPVAVKGAWFWCLLRMWKEKTDSITDSVSNFARDWNCTGGIEECNAIIAHIKAANIAVCNIDCNGNVTLICRRLQRRVQDREATKERVKKHRCNAPETTPVTGVYTSPSLSSSLSSSSSSSNTDGAQPFIDPTELSAKRLGDLWMRYGKPQMREKAIEHARELLDSGFNYSDIEQAYMTARKCDAPWDATRELKNRGRKPSRPVQKMTPIQEYLRAQG